MQHRLALFAVGAAGYGGIEVLARGYTHWTMLLTGGACLVGLADITRRWARLPLLAQAALGGALITGAELAVGCAVNLGLGWHVWDYSAVPGNVLGQICPRYTFYWFCLSVPVCAVLGRCQRRVL